MRNVKVSSNCNFNTENLSKLEKAHCWAISHSRELTKVFMSVVGLLPLGVGMLFTSFWYVGVVMVLVSIMSGLVIRNQSRGSYNFDASVVNCKSAMLSHMHLIPLMLIGYRIYVVTVQVRDETCNWVVASDSKLKSGDPLLYRNTVHGMFKFVKLGKPFGHKE